jgi:glucose-6-phosphate isomerase
MRVLVFDIGGSHVKVFATGQKRKLAIPSGRTMTPERMLAQAEEAISGWKYERVTLGYPGPVRGNKITADAPNLGKGWIGFDFQKEFKRQVKILNDAAMQALGSYKGGRMLFLGLGKGLGSTLILEHVVHAAELGNLPFPGKRPCADRLGKSALKRDGKSTWSRNVLAALEAFKSALQVDYIVLGGGQAHLVRKLPRGVFRGDNRNAFLGGELAWRRANHLLWQ